MSEWLQVEHGVKRRSTLNSREVREKLLAMSDAELIAYFICGEERAFSELDRRYRKKLIAFIYRKLWDKHRAEELVQEVFLRVYKHRDRYDPERRFSAWIYTIAFRLATNELRGRRRRPTECSLEIAAVKMLEVDSQATEEGISFEQEMRRVELLASGLSDEHRRILLLRGMGRSYEEMASILGIPVGTVKSKLSRARRSIRGLRDVCA